MKEEVAKLRFSQFLHSSKKGCKSGQDNPENRRTLNFATTSKVWVLGAGGMLGSALMDLCRSCGIEAYGSTRFDADVSLPALLMQRGKEISPTHIVNCSAYTDVDRAESEPDAAFAVNAQGAAHAAEVAARLEARLIHISTDYVFDGKGSRPYREEDLCAPINCYGRSKWEGEKAVLSIHPNPCVIRTSWLFGGKGKNFISSVLKWLREKEELTVISDQCGRLTYCPEMAQAILDLLDYSGIVHFSGVEAMSRYQIASDLFSAAKERKMPIRCTRILPASTADFPTPAPRPSYSVLDTGKYEAITQRRPRPWSAVINDVFNDAQFS